MVLRSRRRHTPQNYPWVGGGAHFGPSHPMYAHKGPRSWGTTARGAVTAEGRGAGAGLHRGVPSRERKELGMRLSSEDVGVPARVGRLCTAGRLSLLAAVCRRRPVWSAARDDPRACVSPARLIMGSVEKRVCYVVGPGLPPWGRRVPWACRCQVDINDPSSPPKGGGQQR